MLSGERALWQGTIMEPKVKDSNTISHQLRDFPLSNPALKQPWKVEQNKSV
jgi:hypothetical protein